LSFPQYFANNAVSLGFFNILQFPIFQEAKDSGMLNDLRKYILENYGEQFYMYR